MYDNFDLIDNVYGFGILDMYTKMYNIINMIDTEEKTYMEYLDFKNHLKKTYRGMNFTSSR